MPSAIPYQRDHLIELYPHIRGDMADVPIREIESGILKFMSIGPSYTLLDGNQKVICIIGVYRTIPGTGTGWMITSNRVPKNILYITKFAISLRDRAVKELKLHRMQVEVLASKPSWIKWAEKLGFQVECRMKEFCKDKGDLIVMGYIP